MELHDLYSNSSLMRHFNNLLKKIKILITSRMEKNFSVFYKKNIIEEKKVKNFLLTQKRLIPKLNIEKNIQYDKSYFYKVFTNDIIHHSITYSKKFHLFV